MSKRITLAALAALPIAFASMGAQAQMATYCDGRITANAFYANVTGTGSTSTATYFVQLQNRSGDAIRYAVRFRAPNVINAQSGQPIATLASYQQVTITLGQQNFRNPAGTGQLSQQDMIRFTEVQCPR